MPIEIKFDSGQQYQLDAIEAVLEVFNGNEEHGRSEVTDLVLDDGTLDALDRVVIGNQLMLSSEQLRKNLRAVQDKLVHAEDGAQVPAIPEGMRQDWTDETVPDLSVEMETGTGKTYVYIRTCLEMHKRYGFSKFVIVVPGKAIREGVKSSLAMLKPHFKELYPDSQYEFMVWDSAKRQIASDFVRDSSLKIMVINLEAFRTEGNIFRRKDPEFNGGYAPNELIGASRPVVIMDEPQNMESAGSREAIEQLNPLARLRYSATHKDLKHLVYRLTPVDAYDLRLVKRIGVLAITKDEDLNGAYVEVSKITATSEGVTATAKIFKTNAGKTKLTRITLRKDMDLFEESGRRDVYQGWSVEDIYAGRDGERGYVEFGNGTHIYEGAGTTSEEEQHQRLMLRQAIESHFEKELQLKLQLRRGLITSALKPLTLFFIDSVANYHPADGKLRQWFEQEYEIVRSDARFRSLDMPGIDVVHDGYFAASNKGVPKDVTTARGRESAEIESALQRIMRNKEKLLSLEEPLRFIFSYAALAEGWDNPNVFTVCNLQHGRSEMRKRQQIGRGLRLPVMVNGERCRNDDINVVTVIAHEDFSKFAGDLQKEIEDETGIKFTGRIVDLKKDKIKLQLKERVLEDPRFIELWDKISKKTTYALAFSTDDVVADAVRRINAMPAIEPIQFRLTKHVADIKIEGISSSDTQDRGTVAVSGVRKLPDVVGELTRRVPLTRATIVRILSEIDDLGQVKFNPSVFMDQVERAMKEALYAHEAEGIVYRPTGESWRAELFKEWHQVETIAPASMVVAVTKSITDKIVCDSGIEKTFVQMLENRPDVPLFIKLPHWFKIDTPLHGYNPDWAFVREHPEGKYLYLVRETKGTDKLEELQWESEGWKIKFGTAHFERLKVDYSWGNDPKVLIEASADFLAQGQG
ncbi:DEAD/DEAH box helicase family protein [Gordonia alkanivorans]|uniref:restriction endonuclease n=1 Tax=Gordonia alkanivorans TaxID=84096 RepID=UPI002446AF2C|nr:DEAD/DEAH box helicase family protein [Gordonia alkanivorans]MDH3044289.1 DEAD/DEAH box helicase family protein [Gordonia alkanivorans]